MKTPSSLVAAFARGAKSRALEPSSSLFGARSSKKGPRGASERRDDDDDLPRPPAVLSVLRLGAALGFGRARGVGAGPSLAFA